MSIHVKKDKFKPGYKSFFVNLLKIKILSKLIYYIAIWKFEMVQCGDV